MLHHVFRVECQCFFRDLLVVALLSSIGELVEDDLVQFRVSLDDFETEFRELVHVFNGMIDDEENNVELADFFFVEFILLGTQDLACKGFDVLIVIDFHNAQLDDFFEGRSVLDGLRLVDDCTEHAFLSIGNVVEDIAE